MKTQHKLIFVSLGFILVGGLISGCGSDQNQVVAQTMAALTQKAIMEAAATNTPLPPPTATETPLPSATPTPTITPTPDYTNFNKVTPAAASVNVASYKNVNFKFVKMEIGSKVIPLDPNATTGKEYEFNKGQNTANIYFMADVNAIYNKVISTNTYVIVTFSNGEKQLVLEGWNSKGGALKGFYASEKTDTVGEADFAFAIPEEGMEIVELQLAESAKAKDNAVVLFKK
ncbi:hypothetical protein [Leptolinea tardivitalis]|uniref:DUF4352 domain-containing protein n=1 Tax=Leptolinea tardivitalis TaxID=229920 RepID=A0A0N8GLR0_9CHLR|nr:hypothetical protein [Leptolinea tardivitalis]KPL73194.1 hypothetical protein ADM99_02840 [Leptolinea tardivitalis]GAP21296.1 hypothetical protein LTAR_01507 [Leptolinea tardivitalis]